jgi:hypothetical protein
MNYSRIEEATCIDNCEDAVEMNTNCGGMVELSQGGVPQGIEGLYVCLPIGES